MKKIIIEGFKLGDEVVITTYNPPIKATVADMYEIPFEQVPMYDQKMINKYHGKNVQFFEVFIDGKIQSFVKDVIRKA